MGLELPLYVEVVAVNPAVKKLADRLAKNQALLAKARKALLSGEPLWVIGIMEQETDVRAAIALLDAK